MSVIACSQGVITLWACFLKVTLMTGTADTNDGGREISNGNVLNNY